MAFHTRRSFRSSSQICHHIWAAGRAAEGGTGEERWCSARDNNGAGDAAVVTLCRGMSCRRVAPALLGTLGAGVGAAVPVCSHCSGACFHRGAMDGASPSCGRAGVAIEAPCCNRSRRGDCCRWREESRVSGLMNGGAGTVALGSGAGEAPGHGHMDRSCRAATRCLKTNPLRNERPWVQTWPLPLFALGSSGISASLHPLPQISPQ